MLSDQYELQLPGKISVRRKMHKVHEATYLGGQLNDRGDHKADLQIRMGLAAGTWKKPIPIMEQDTVPPSVENIDLKRGGSQ